MLERIADKTKIMEKALDASWLRNEVISQNLANVDTPGYKRKTVIFEECLNEAMDRSSRKSLKGSNGYARNKKAYIDDVEMRVIEDNKSLSYRLDRNNVDIDNEMADMAKNTIKYNVITQSLNASFRRLKSVISEGRR